MTTENSFHAEIAAAIDGLLDSKRCAVEKKEALQQAGKALKAAEKSWKRARKESRQAIKSERKSQKLHDQLCGRIEKSKKRPANQTAKPEDKLRQSEQAGKP